MIGKITKILNIFDVRKNNNDNDINKIKFWNFFNENFFMG